MKKIFFVFILSLFIQNKLQAQFPYPVGSFTSHPELNKFVGDWKWGSGADSVILHLEKQFVHYPQPLNFDEELLVGWHKYIKNGTIVETSLQYSGLPYIGGHSSILAGMKSPIKLYGSFREHTKSKKCDLYLTMINSSFTQMDWRLLESRGLKSQGFLYGFTLPVNIVLIKQ